MKRESIQRAQRMRNVSKMDPSYMRSIDEIRAELQRRGETVSRMTVLNTLNRAERKIYSALVGTLIR